jgi:ubiquinone/menaquinone biosynthesis C-methylase UbiE
MAPWTDDPIAQARCREGDRVLDRACGTGRGDAADLPFPDSPFDTVPCRQGLGYVPDRAAAVKETARILSLGGMALPLETHLFTALR